ncbi:arginine deiminase [Desulfosarcina alkanivorans]|uniref:arginine deiminase n=1 Tax=Desulfosarcina alkanivorans TaxID=571177 RepID=A0A5K7YAR8_9BACT|nr:arginine deiminase family protein [Desulfosarcina alkanivorans]BBO66492.1 arginine deiminase [Desulfosarcina alkanivorans]
MKIGVNSEIGGLEGVVLHTPGPEVENMTPRNAERALYSDILNLSVAQKEYAQLADLLDTVTETYQVRDLLESVLAEPAVKSSLVMTICEAEGCLDLCDDLLALTEKTLARQFIEGVVQPRDNLTRFLSRERYSLPPLHNFFFTRDAAMAITDEILIGRMAKPVRSRESIIMEAIFNHCPRLSARTVNPLAQKHPDPAATIEGGDVLVARDDVLVIGNGSRTSTQGIDFIIERLKAQRDRERHLLVQELPHSPESFIHLDMVFTLLDQCHCMVFGPLMLQPSKYQAIHITVENGRVTRIREEKSLIEALRGVGMDLTPVCCGGVDDLWIQEREQWHSGANFFALAPGKVVGYARNVHTMEEMNNNGFDVLPADEIISGRRQLKDLGRCAITLDGSELPRGGGGARCMTMPVRRRPVTG